MVVVEAGAAAETGSRARSEGKESRAQEKKGTGELIDKYFGLRSFTFHLTERKRARPRLF
jgi:hypothetical protein